MQVTSATAPTLSREDTANTANRIPQKQLGQNDFLKLLTVQLTNQDPMKPMEDTQSIAQMAQFSSLQQMSTMNAAIQAMRRDSQLSSAGSLIGREATVQTPDGPVTGVIESVEQSEDGPLLTINGKPYAYGALTRVAAVPPTSAAADQPAALPSATNVPAA